MRIEILMAKLVNKINKIKIKTNRMLHSFWITKINECQIGISPCPAGGVDLKIELEKIVLEDQLLLISLLTEEEIIQLKLHDEKLISEELRINFKEFPIVDSSIPGVVSFINFIEKIYSLTNKFDRILIHCQAGIGRSSLIALGLMTKHRLILKESIKLASSIRGFEVPQSRSQLKLLHYYAESLFKLI